MLKQVKYIKLICIVLIFSILALGLAVAFLSVGILKNISGPDPLAGWEERTEKVTMPALTEENTQPFAVRSDMSLDAVYLRAESFGDYNGKTWDPAIPYTALIDEKYPATYLSVKQIEAWNLADPYALEIVPNDSVLATPQYTATKILGNTYAEEYTIPVDDVTANPKGDEYYRMYYYNYTNTSLKPSISVLEYAGYEEKYRAFVYDQYLTIDSDIKAYMLDIAEKNGFEKSDYEVSDKISEYVKNIGTYSIEYDKGLDDEDNMISAFMEKYKEGTCKHFASVATLLFRALGIPARFVIGYMTETEAGEWVELTNYDAHAWVEVYVDGFGWKNIEVTPQLLDNNVTVKPIDVSRIYDGSPLYPEQKIEGLEEYLKKGYTYEVVVSGERTDPGISESKIESLKIFDAQGKDITSEFTIEYETGEILIYAGVISLESDDFTYVYIGTSPLSQLSLCRAVLPEGESLAEGHKIELKQRQLPSAMGVHPHAFDVVVTDSLGQDVTKYYKFQNNFGTVTVIANELKLKAGSAEKIYDGQPLTCNEIEVVSGVLADGDTIVAYEVVGSQTAPGESENVIELSSIVIMNKNGEDVTSNYVLSVEDGTLTVYIIE